MERLWREVRLACRRMTHARVFSLFAITCVALAIGATTGVYSFVHVVLHGSRALPDTDRVVNVYKRGAPRLALTLTDVDYLKRTLSVFDRLVPWTAFRLPVSGPGGAEVVFIEAVGGEYFDLVGAIPENGRGLTPSDDDPAQPAVVVVSHGLAERLLGGRAVAVGKTLRIVGRTFAVVGVAPGWFRGVNMPNLAPTHAWVPIRSAIKLAADPADASASIWVKGRLERGRTVADAKTDLARASALRDDLRSARRPAGPAPLFYPVPASSVLTHETTDTLARMLAVGLSGSALLVLLVAATNLAGVIAGRNARRTSELATQLALGASRSAVSTRLTIESVLLVAVGGLCGLAVAWLIAKALALQIALVPGLDLSVHPQLDLPVLLAGIGATGIVALVAGLLPALKAWRTDVRYLLTSQGMTASPRWRAHRLAIFVQVLISSALLVLAAWNLNHLLSTELHGAGFSVENTVIGELDFSMQRYPPERALARLESLRTRLRSVAGVTGVEIATGLPFGTRMLRGTVAAGRGDLVPGTASLSVGVIATTPGYFAALRLPVLAGQVPSTDVDDEVWSVLINESTSESVFGTPAGLGRELSVRVQSLTAGRYLTNRARVVGIVPDTDVGGLGRREDGMIYLAYHDHYEPFAAVVVSHAAGARGVADAMRAAVREIDPDLVLLRVQTGRDLLDDQSLIVRFVAGVTLGLGGLALFLALTGLCSIMLHSTALRRRELGIRAAMGASAPTLARMLVGDNTRVLIPGILAGAALGHWAGSLLSRIRWVGVEPNSLLSFVGVPALVFGLAIVACLLLATRAARVHPAEALRHL